MSKSQKIMIGRMAATLVLLIAAVLLKSRTSGWVTAVMFLVPYLLIGYDVLYSAARNILRGQVFDEKFLMTVAGIGAFAIGEYAESVAVMLFFQVGELFEDFAVDKSRKSISDLMDICPDRATVIRDGKQVEIDAEDVQVGETVVVKPGERIPVDGTVQSGQSELDTMALTGESLPREVAPGDKVNSGCVNMSGMLYITTEKTMEESTAAKILAMVEDSGENKAKSESFITRFAKYYTPAVVGCAVVLGVVVPIFAGQWSMWINRALIFLVTSCPCALVVSVPMSFFCGIGSASKKGVLIKGSSYLETLGKATAVAFDKTGTLTKGTFSVTEVRPVGDKEELMRLAAAAESASNHPIAKAVTAAWKGEMPKVENIQEIAGHGITAEIEGGTVAAGNLRLMEKIGITGIEDVAYSTAVHVAKDGKYLGCILVADTPKEDAKAAIAELKASGVSSTIMLTGDKKAVAEKIAGELGIDRVCAELLPGEKVGAIEDIIKGGDILAYAGDGINDAPAIRRADVGIAMGAMGSDAAIEAADVVLMDDNIRKRPVAIKIARKAGRIVKENIVFALAVKFIVLVLGATGVTDMWAAVFADVGTLVLAVLNAMRSMRIK